ncbi:MAG: putative nicotinate-nucleotide adenylyltransferase [Paracoccaceae bacterium]|nr:MAG: putative nicotinate-nucleotide adenylyltransferase [Paracoccaceae bacterium]
MAWLGAFVPGGEAVTTGAPLALAGMTVGLLGGSFDPAHAGHVHITRLALAALGLDRVWWLVSPGNPLKSRGPADLDRRLAAARAVMRHPRVEITDIEARLGTRHTAQTLRALARRYPGVRFVWLMGADNLIQFHRWRDWRGIMARVPVAVLPRPGAMPRAGLSPAARAFARARIRAGAARALARSRPPAWVLLPGPRRADSSTEIRDRGGWPG